MTFALTDKQYNELIQARLKSPESFKKALVSRKRRKMVGKDGRLLIVAADHTARGIISAGSEKYIIANRRLLLDRLVRSLSNPNVDGVLASADIVEELAWRTRIKTCIRHDESRRLPRHDMGPRRPDDGL